MRRSVQVILVAVGLLMVHRLTPGHIALAGAVLPHGASLRSVAKATHCPPAAPADEAGSDDEGDDSDGDD